MIECISCPSTNRGDWRHTKAFTTGTPKKKSGYMGLSKIKVPKNNNNEDTLRVWGVPPHFQPPYNVRQDLTMRPSKI